MILVFDMGATRTRLALTDGVNLSNVYRFDTDRSARGLEKFASEVKRYAADQGVIEAIGGFPGHFDREGRVVHATNLPEWIGQPVRQRLHQALGVNVTIRNDVELVGLGEAIEGAGRGYEIVAYVTVSTGVNGVRIVRGVIDPSVYGFEIGSQLVPDEKGTLVSLEEATGGAALEHRLGKHPKEIRDRQFWKDEAGRLAVGLYNTMLHWSPDVIVLGGGMMADIKLDDIAEALRAWPQVYERWPDLVRAGLNDDGGLHGAMVYYRGLPWAHREYESSIVK